MVKRFTDTEIWNKDWFLELNMKQKLLTKFLFDACDCAGFYQISWFKLKIFFGEEVTKEDFEKLHFVKFLKEDFIYLENFILFQYKLNSLEELNPSNNAHKGILKRLKEFSPLLAPNKPLVSPINGVIGRRKKEEGKNNSSNLEERKENLTKEKKEEKILPFNLDERKTDPFSNPLLDDYFSTYKQNCTNLCKLGFEPRNRETRELLSAFIDEIDNDVGYFNSLCLKANELKTICNKQIDFKSLLRNHIGIMNGKYKEKTAMDEIEELFKSRKDDG